MKYLRIVITTIWLCQPTLYYVDGYQDLGTIGHCQKSGCRNSPDHANEEAYNGNLRGGSRAKKYVAEYEPQSESLPVITPGEFMCIFVILLLALHIKHNGLTSIQIWYDKICKTARQSLVSLRAKSSGNKGGVVVASAGIRSRFISSRSAASLGSLVDLIGPDSEHDDLGGFDVSLDESNSSIGNVLDSSFHDVLNRSLRRRFSRNYSSGSLGESSCISSQASSYNSESSVGMNVFADSPYDSDGASSNVKVGASAELPFCATKFARRASMDPPDSDTVMATTDVIPASIKVGGRKKPKNKIDNVDKTVLSKFLNNLAETHCPVSNKRSSIARSIDDNCSRKPSRRSTVDTALLSQSCIR
jgi:hypothetical protein